MESSKREIEPRPAFIWGAGGQIGSHLVRELVLQNHPHSVCNWREPRLALQRASEYPNGVDWVFCSGLTNPRLSTEALDAANLTFVQDMISAAEKLSHRNRYLTIGTIHENFAELCQSNSYLSSKKRLGEWVTQRQLEAPERFLHLRLHTIYSSTLHAHMFLGQLLEALRTRTPFEMSTGEQLREYHHSADIAVCIRTLLDAQWDELHGVLELSQGNAVSLAQLAQHVFRAFGCDELLRLGARGASPAENWNRQFVRTDPRWFPVARDPLEGVTQALREALQARGI